MSLNWPNQAGPRDVNSYLEAGTPFLTASALKSGQILEISFLYLSKEITVRNSEFAFTGSDSKSRLSFGVTLSGTISSSNGGLGHHRFEVGPNQIVQLGIRTPKLFVSNSKGRNSDQKINFQICAGLTFIPAGSFNLTGSVNSTGSFKGVG